MMFFILFCRYDTDVLVCYWRLRFVDDRESIRSPPEEENSGGGCSPSIVVMIGERLGLFSFFLDSRFFVIVLFFFETFVVLFLLLLLVVFLLLFDVVGSSTDESSKLKSVEASSSKGMCVSSGTEQLACNSSQLFIQQTKGWLRRLGSMPDRSGRRLKHRAHWTWG